MGLLTFTAMSEQEILELENQKAVRELIPVKEIFDKIAQRKQLRKFHFQAIEYGDKIVLFNGRGEELHEFENDFYGKRKARVFAVDHFNSFPKEQTNGGYTFDFV